MKILNLSPPHSKAQDATNCMVLYRNTLRMFHIQAGETNQ